MACRLAPWAQAALLAVPGHQGLQDTLLGNCGLCRNQAGTASAKASCAAGLCTVAMDHGIRLPRLCLFEEQILDLVSGGKCQSYHMIV